MKDDEREFLKRVQEATKKMPPPSFVLPRKIAKEMGLNEKRAAYICGKWVARGWYEYGVNVLAGWLTDTGLKIET